MGAMKDLLIENVDRTVAVLEQSFGEEAILYALGDFDERYDRIQGAAMGCPEPWDCFSLRKVLVSHTNCPADLLLWWDNICVMNDR